MTRDGVLVATLVAWSAAEMAFGHETAWRPIVFAVSLIIALTLPWRRTHPLASVAVAFGTLIAFDIARSFAVDVTGLASIAAVLVLPYSLLRWGSGREGAIGLALILAWLPLTLLVTREAEPIGAAEVVAAFGFFLCSAALGSALRFHAAVRVRDIEQAQLRQRNELARELHDTVGHHLSAIAVAAQAGRVAAGTDHRHAVAALEIIEAEASRTLAQMRTMLRGLRGVAAPDLTPQPGLPDIAKLATGDGVVPQVAVHLPSDLGTINPSVGLGLYRIARESLTNAIRHAHNPTRVDIRVSNEGDQVRLTVHDDGEARGAAHGIPGYGLLGMTERATLLGGTLRAGSVPDGGWSVDAVVPKQGGPV